jgi:hypothetical protein
MVFQDFLPRSLTVNTRRFSLCISSSLFALALFIPLNGFAQEEGDSSPSGDVLGRTEFFVEEFVPNRIKVSASAPEARQSTSVPLELTVRAEEMFGQAAGGRRVKVTMQAVPAPFTPAGYEGFTFGDSERKYASPLVELDPQELDDEGRRTFPLSVPDAAPPPAALKVVIQATVMDSGGRGVTSVLERTLDPVPYYLGLKNATDGFLKPGAEGRFDIVGVLPDASITTSDTLALNAEISRVKYNSVLRRNDRQSYQYETSRELTSVQKMQLVLNAGRGNLLWTPNETGSFLIRLEDPATGSAVSQIVYVSSGIWSEQSWSLEKPESLELKLDRSEYGVSDTARLLVKSPFAGTLFLTLEQDKVLTSSVHQMPTNTLEVGIPLSADIMPNAFATAVVVRPVRPAEKWLPHRAAGTVNIPVSPATRRLGVDITAPTEVRPEQKLKLSLRVGDLTTSEPRPAQVTVWAVDEGVLSLTGFETPDPIDFFYCLRRLGVQSADNFANLMPDLIQPAVASSHTGGDGGLGMRRLSPISAERVKPVVLWAGTQNADSSGMVNVQFDVPRFMGRLRVMAVAATGPRFGSGEATVFVRGPVMVQDNLPRFLAPGDRAEASFVVFNNTDVPLTGTLNLKVSGPLKFRDDQSNAAAERKISFGGKDGIAARGQEAVRVNLSASPMAGVARVSFDATAGEVKYGDETEIPVRPAAPFVQRSGFQRLAAGSEARVDIASLDALAGTTSGSLMVSAMPEVRLSGALRHLVNYPYGCLEQTVSSAFPLMNLAAALGSDLPRGMIAESVPSVVQTAVDRILMMQKWNGGMSMWMGGDDEWLWGTVYAAHFLTEARREGYVVPAGEYDGLLGRLESLLADGQKGMESDRAYAAWVLAMAGKSPRDRMELLLDQRETLTPEGRALLAGAYMAIGEGAQAGKLLAETGSGDAATSVARATSGNLRSANRENAILLLARLQHDPTAAEVPTLADRLYNGMNERGDWGTTQDTAFALLALERYEKVRQESQQPFRAEVHVEGRVLSATEKEPLTLNEYLGGKKVTVALTGPGAAYAFWRAEGVPQQPPREPVAEGLTVKKRFLNRQGEEMNLEKGLKQGDFVVVEITLETRRTLNNLIIEDLLPAGFEVENPNLKTAETILGGEGDQEGDMSGVRTEVRDDRMIAFVDGVAGQKQVFRYAIRAVTPGEYTLPPVQVSCMYDPEVRALQPGGRVEIRR